MRTRAILAVVALSFAVLLPHVSIATELDDFRVWGISSNVFEYCLMSVSGQSQGKTCLAFNHLSGRTSFVREGEKLGEYMLKAYEVEDERVFNDTINAYQTRRDGTATLLGPDGRTIELKLGKPRGASGFMALLVNLKDGSAAYARPGDLMDYGPLDFNVASVMESGAVTVEAATGARTVPLASATERQSVVDLWTAQRAAEQQPVQDKGMEVGVANVGVNEARQDVVRIPPIQQEQALPLVVGRPRRLIQLTFNPLEVVSVQPGRPIPVMAAGPVQGPDGTVRPGITPVQTAIQMPQFKVFSYRGTVSVYGN